MANLGPGAVFGAYRLREPQFSLLACAALPLLPEAGEDGEQRPDPDGRRSDVLGPDGTFPRWVTGLSWAPENSGASVLVADPNAQPTTTFTPPASPAVRTLLPVLVETGDKITALQYRSRDFEGRVRRQILAMSHPKLGAEFWAGAVQAANPNLIDATTTIAITGAPAGGGSPLRVLAELESALGAAGYGEDGMIHAERRLVTEWAAQQLVFQVGSNLYTRLGTLVVADPGYPGTGPDASGGLAGGTASSWAYATDMVTVWASPIVIVPDNTADGGLGGAMHSPGRVGAALDPSVNTVTYRADRILAAGFDGRRLFACKALLPA